MEGAARWSLGIRGGEIRGGEEPEDVGASAEPQQERRCSSFSSPAPRSCSSLVLTAGLMHLCSSAPPWTEFLSVLFEDTPTRPLDPELRVCPLRSRRKRTSERVFVLEEPL